MELSPKESATRKKSQKKSGAKSLPQQKSLLTISSSRHKRSTKAKSKQLDGAAALPKVNEAPVPTEHEVSTAVCQDIAKGFLDYALDICFERFMFERGAEILAWELRDLALDVVTMNWNDTDYGGVEPLAPNSIFSRATESIPLPPKIDLWANGAMESLPNKCRESVVDPFLRDPLPWYLEPLESSTDDETAAAEIHPVRKIPRPKSPKRKKKGHSTDTDTWSTATSSGKTSYTLLARPRKCKPRIPSECSLGQLSATCCACTVRAPNDCRACRAGPRMSVELLYPCNITTRSIKASSEMAYCVADTTTRNVSASGSCNDFVAFTLPCQTSSHSGGRNRRTQREPCDDYDDNYCSGNSTYGSI